MKYLKTIVAATILAVSSVAMAELGQFNGTWVEPGTANTGSFVFEETSEGEWTDNGRPTTEVHVVKTVTGGNTWVDASTMTGSYGSTLGALAVSSMIDGLHWMDLNADGTYTVHPYTADINGAVYGEAYLIDANGNRIVTEEEVAQERAQPIDTGYILMTGTMNGKKEMMIMYIDMRDGSMIGKVMVLQFFDESHNWNDSYETIYIDVRDFSADTEVLMTSFK